MHKLVEACAYAQSGSIDAARRRRWDQPLGRPLGSSRSTAETVNPSVTQRLPVTKQLVCYPHKQQLHNCPSTPNSAPTIRPVFPPGQRYVVGILSRSETVLQKQNCEIAFHPPLVESGSRRGLGSFDSGAGRRRLELRSWTARGARPMKTNGSGKDRVKRMENRAENRAIRQISRDFVFRGTLGPCPDLLTPGVQLGRTRATGWGR